MKIFSSSFIFCIYFGLFVVCSFAQNSINEATAVEDRRTKYGSTRHDVNLPISNLIPIVTKISFYPRNTQTARLAGGIVQGANVYSLNASDWTDLYTISGAINIGEYNERTFPNAIGYKFLRIFFPGNFNNQGDVSEFRFQNAFGDILYDNVFGKPGYEDGNPQYNYPNAFDDNIETDYATASSAESNYYGIVVRTAMTLDTLDNATVGNLYNESLTGGGGTAPYTTQIIKGVLPHGLLLSGNHIIGNPAIGEISQVTIEGDSIANGFGSDVMHSPRKILEDLLGSRWIVNDVSTPAETLSQMNFQFVNQVKDKRSVLYNRDIVILEGGTNSIGFGATLAQTQTDFDNYSAKVLTEKFQFVAQPILPRIGSDSWNSTKESIRNDYNSYLTSHNERYDILVTLLPQLLDSSNTVYFLDNLHLTPAGNLNLAQSWKNAIDTLPLQQALGSTQTVRFTVRLTDANGVFQDFVREITVSI